MDFPFVKEAISQLFSKPSCAMYPAVESIAAPRYRGRIAFDPTKCINCLMCEDTYLFPRRILHISQFSFLSFHIRI